MLAMILCVVMKILEYSSGAVIETHPTFEEDCTRVKAGRHGRACCAVKPRRRSRSRTHSTDRGRSCFHQQNQKPAADFRGTVHRCESTRRVNATRGEAKVTSWNQAPKPGSGNAPRNGGGCVVIRTVPAQTYARRRHDRRMRRAKGLPLGGGTAGGTGMAEEVLKAAGALSGPGADCNSNHTNNGETTASYLSNTSSHHDIDFIQDNSDDQWFLDYGYRDSLHHHVSVLCGIESGLYDDLAVAEVDMEHFQIQSLLHTLPALCRADLQTGIDSNRQGEMIASVTGSMMAQFEFESSISPHSSSQGEDSAGSTDAMSLCKSELLFSPVKECPLPGTINFSVDSLDSDIMLTCQANKDNYTIAFEGSTTMCSEDSDYQENVESDTTTGSEENNWSRCTKVVNPQVAAVKSERRTIFNTSLGATGETGGTPSKGSPGGRHLGVGNMARSDSVFTTWSKLNGTKTEHPLDTQQLSRHPSGNNNTRIDNGEVDPTADNARITNDNTDSATVKSRSLPNLARQQLRRCLANKTNAGSTSVSSVESMCVKLYDVQNNSSPLTSSGASSSSSGGRLVRLFMKQRSGSSIASDCWDSDSCVRSTSYVGRKANRNVNRSTGPVCNTVYQSCPGGRDMTALCADAEKPEKKELFEDSLYREDGSADRSHDQIVEEDGPSESVERISESLSKAIERDSTLENVHSCDYSSNYSSHHGLPGSRERVPPDGEAACHCNVNNNNSVEGSRRESRGSICSCNTCSCGSGRCAVHRHSGTQMPVPLISRSIQTSCILDIISKTTLEEEQKDKEMEKDDREKEKEKVEVETNEQTTLVSGISFDEQKQSKPVYVYYPDYALPDLDFLRDKQQIDMTKVYLKPQKFSPAAATQDKNLLSKVPACLRQPTGNKPKRPFSCNDIEDLRKKGFGHVRDWNSLAMLLPDEYRQYLAEIPEVSEHIDEKVLTEGQPLFCVSPPKSRVNPCECGSLSSASSTNTQPSSGYRGSSTLLSDSSSPAPNFNPMFVYRYDSVSSEASLNQADKKKGTQVPQLPKRSISLPAAGKGSKRVPVEVPPPPRPPLPKGILRHPSEDTVICNTKLRKETNNKRYSMFEMGLTELDSGRRASLHDPGSVRIRTRSRSEDGLGGTTTEEDEGVDASSERYTHRQPCCDHANFEEVLRLSDFLHISETGLSDGSAEEWDQDKMNKLRLQVSRFLSANGCEVTEECQSDCGGTCHCERKVVTFNTETENCKEKLKTPPNSPNMSAPHISDHRQYQCKVQQQPPLSDLPIREEDSCDASTASACLSAKSPVDMQQKKELVSAVSDAVEKVINHFSSGATLNECTRLGDSASSPAVAEVVLGWLCPALYAILSDGLLPSISSAFGDISNSVWQVVEASAQQGPMTRSLNELVLRLNSEDVFAEGLLKFNAFIFGLLNVHSMDAWMAYLRTRESIIRKHYSPESLLVLSSSGGPQYRALTDRLLAALRPLTLLPFRLDLLFECRQLHQSLQRLSQPAASPSALIRLVRSIQNSVGQMPPTQEETNFVRKNSVGNGIATDGGEQPAPTLRRISRSGAIRQLRRPRSCVEPSEIDRNEPNNFVCKRWSGVQLGSKLSLALDRLMAEDTEEEYTDSIERDAHPNRKRASHQSDNSTSDDPETLVSMENISDADIETDSSERKSASDGSTEATHRPQRKAALGVGGKFRRLQMKWELLTGSGSESRNGSTRTSPETSPMKSVRPRVPSNSTVTSPAASPIKSSSSRSSLTGGASPSGSSTTSTSRIPRPITSPVRPPSGIPVLSSTSKKLVSPTQQPPGLPHATQMKRPTSASVRPSRVDQPIPPGEHRSPALRPSSLPYSPASHSSLDKNKKSTPPRRATSASVSRTTNQTNKTNKPTQRLVRTVKHQLASDGGHLSFSAGERLVLVLEVDEQWLLCRKGHRMGLVRRSAVVATQDHLAGF